MNDLERLCKIFDIVGLDKAKVMSECGLKSLEEIEVCLGGKEEQEACSIKKCVFSKSCCEAVTKAVVDGNTEVFKLIEGRLNDIGVTVYNLGKDDIAAEVNRIKMSMKPKNKDPEPVLDEFSEQEEVFPNDDNFGEPTETEEVSEVNDIEEINLDTVQEVSDEFVEEVTQPVVEKEEPVADNIIDLDKIKAEIMEENTKASETVETVVQKQEVSVESKVVEPSKTTIVIPSSAQGFELTIIVKPLLQEKVTVEEIKTTSEPVLPPPSANKLKMIARVGEIIANHDKNWIKFKKVADILTSEHILFTENGVKDAIINVPGVTWDKFKDRYVIKK